MYTIKVYHTSSKQSSISPRGSKFLELKRKWASLRGTGICAPIIHQLLKMVNCYFVVYIFTGVPLCKEKGEFTLELCRNLFVYSSKNCMISLNCTKGKELGNDTNVKIPYF